MDTDIISKINAANQSTYSLNMNYAVIRQQQKSQQAVVELVNQSVDFSKSIENLPPGVGKNLDISA